MKVGLIGAGQIGATLARALAGAGHRVLLANSRGPDTIRDLATDLGARAGTVAEAAGEAEVIFLSVPFGAVAGLPAGLFDEVAEPVPVIDTCNYYPGLRDDRIEPIECGMAESEWVAQTLRRPVIKAFNSIGFPSLATKAQPRGHASRISLPVSGDNAQMKAQVMALMDGIGFDPVDAGSLAESWRQQPGTPAYCTDLDRASLVTALAIADRGQAPQRRDDFVARMLPFVRAGEPVDLVALGRSVYGAP